jgi:hypothetical protein
MNKTVSKKIVVKGSNKERPAIIHCTHIVG